MGDALLRKPISGFAVCCCARAASGHPAAAPPKSVMKSRRLMALPTRGPHRIKRISHLHTDRYALAAMSALGQTGHDRGVGIERLTDLEHLLAAETAAGPKLRDSFEVTVLPTRQAPAQHASRDEADVLEAVHEVARDEDDAAGTGLGGLIADGHLIETLDDEQNLFLFEMDVVGWALAGLVPRHDNRGGAAGGLGSEEHIHVEAERFDRQRLFGRNDGGLQRGSRVRGGCLQFFTICEGWNVTH